MQGKDYMLDTLLLPHSCNSNRLRGWTDRATAARL